MHVCASTVRYVYTKTSNKKKKQDNTRVQTVRGLEMQLEGIDCEIIIINNSWRQISIVYTSQYLFTAFACSLVRSRSVYGSFVAIFNDFGASECEFNHNNSNRTYSSAHLSGLITSMLIIVNGTDAII